MLGNYGGGRGNGTQPSLISKASKSFEPCSPCFTILIGENGSGSKLNGVRIHMAAAISVFEKPSPMKSNGTPLALAAT